MSELSLLLFDPLIEAYRYVFLAIHGLLGSYGWSIVLLSCLISFALTPLTRWSQKLVDRENEFASVLAPQIAKIKSESSGEARHRRIQQLYRRYGYSPLFALRKVAPLFIQIPALLLTYYMLQGFEAIDGVAFYAIEDLGAGISTPGFTKKELLQALIIAALFLALLYSQSSALLLFWTTNNAILLARNARLALSRRKKQYGSYELRGIFRTAMTVAASTPVLALAAYLATLAAVALSDWGRLTISQQSLLSLLLCSPLIASLIARRYLHRGRKIADLLCAAQLLALASLTLGQVAVTLGVVAVFNLSFWVVFWLNPDRTGLRSACLRLQQNLPRSNQGLLIFGLCAYSLFSLLIDTPLTLYSYDPKEFYGVDPGVLFASFGLIFAIGLLVVALCLRWLSSFARALVLPLAVFTALLTLLYSKLVIPDYGLMDGFMFLHPDSITQTRFTSALETVALALLLWLAVLYMPRFKAQLPMFLILLVSVSVVSASMGVYRIASPGTQYTPPATNAREFTLKLSPRKPNVLIILLDGFSGGYLATLLREDTSIRKHLDGFVWYQNALSSGAATMASIGAIVGGHRFTVDKAIAADLDRVDELVNAAYPVMPVAFAEKGYEVSFVDTHYGADLSATEAAVFEIRPDESVFEQSKQLAILKTLTMLSLFNTVPLFARDFVYDDGGWHLWESRKSRSSPAYREKLAHVDFLQQLGQKPVQTSETPSFSFIHVQVPHAPWLITANGPGDSLQDGKYEDESRFALHKLQALFAQMKAAGVYESTQIQVVSDHGWWVENELFDPDYLERLGAGYNHRRSPGFVHALMLVKSPGAPVASLADSDRLVSNADVPAIACALIAGCPGVIQSPLSSSRARTLNYNIVDLDVWPDRGRLRDYLKEQWTVKDNIFDPDNWTRVR